MAEQAPQQPPGRLEYFDAVRGIAAMSVVWGHCLLAFAPEIMARLNPTPISALTNGAAAVAMFFVLSGYVLSFRYLSEEKMQNFHLWSFYVRRYCRIVPTYIAVLALSYLAYISLYTLPDSPADPAYSRWAVRMWSDKKIDLPTMEYLKSILMILPKTQFPFVPQAWTLRIEMGMSLLLPFMILLVCRSPWWLIAFAVVTVKILNLYIYIAHFTLGILLAMHAQTLVALLHRHRILNWVTPIVGFLLYNYRNAPPIIHYDLSPANSHLVMAIGSTMLLVWIMANATAQRILHWAPLQFMGRVSYSLYLVHIIILLAITPLLMAWWNQLGVTGHGSAALAFIAVTLLSLALAALTYKFVERPSIQLGYYLSGKLKRPPA